MRPPTLFRLISGAAIPAFSPACFDDAAQAITALDQANLPGGPDPAALPDPDRAVALTSLDFSGGGHVSFD